MKMDAALLMLGAITYPPTRSELLLFYGTFSTKQGLTSPSLLHRIGHSDCHSNHESLNPHLTPHPTGILLVSWVLDDSCGTIIIMLSGCQWDGKPMEMNRSQKKFICYSRDYHQSLHMLLLFQQKVMMWASFLDKKNQLTC